jgi:hypothetical protein
MIKLYLLFQIHANCRIRRVYFSDRLYSEDELPAEFKLYLPVQQNKTKVNEILLYSTCVKTWYINPCLINFAWFVGLKIWHTTKKKRENGYKMIYFTINMYIEYLFYILFCHSGLSGNWRIWWFSNWKRMYWHYGTWHCLVGLFVKRTLVILCIIYLHIVIKNKMLLLLSLFLWFGAVVLYWLVRQHGTQCKFTASQSRKCLIF